MDDVRLPESLRSRPTPQRSKESEELARILSEARNRLIDTGTRNRLIHTNRDSKRPSTIAILHSDSNLLFTQLRDGKSLRFRADAAATARERTIKPNDPTEEAEEDFGGPLPQTSTDALQTRAGENSLQKRLLKIVRDSKALEDEQGINVLYLAIGFLRWYEDDQSDVIREAPLILVPVNVVRDIRRSSFDLKAREDEIAINQPLAERLQGDFGIALPPLPDGEDWTAHAYFGAVRDVIGPKLKWSVDPSGLELGFFSFAKLLMFHDLAARPWPEEKILKHPILRGLLQEGFHRELDPFPDGTRIDERFSASDLIHVVDADGSQTLAIETVRSGRNLVIQGPPGTGKSQTITNILASAAFDGKKVLFVAEKMVALEVVHKRLIKSGLNNLCLELHSRSANKRSIVEELSRTLSDNSGGANIADNAGDLTRIRDELNGYSAALHSPLADSGMTPFQMLGDLVRARGLNRSPPVVVLDAKEFLFATRYLRLTEAVTRLVECMGISGRLHAQPWHGAGNSTLQPFDLQRLGDRLNHCEAALVEATGRAKQIANGLQVAVPGCLEKVRSLSTLLDVVAEAPIIHKPLISQLQSLTALDTQLVVDLCEAGQALSRSQVKFSSLFVEAALSVETAAIRSSLAQGISSFLSRMGRGYRQASSELSSWLKGTIPKAACARVALIDELTTFQTCRNKFYSHAVDGNRLLGPFYRGERTDFDACQTAFKWLSSARENGLTGSTEQAIAFASELADLKDVVSVIRSSAEVLTDLTRDIIDVIKIDCRAAFGADAPEKASLVDIQRCIGRYHSSLETYPNWVMLVQLDRSLRQQGGADIADRLADGRLSADEALEEVRHARAEMLWREAIARNPPLGNLDGATRFRLVSDFSRRDRDRLPATAKMIKARHLAALPRGAMGEMAVIRGEIGRKRGHMAIRKLMSLAGKTIQEIKPILLMSPMSVAQFLPPGAIDFDLVVFDEASQVRPEDALGVIARAKQIVVVGDRKQLPPTSFFARLLNDESPDASEDENMSGAPLAGAAQAGDMESILSLCEARGLLGRMLRWHYRSRHPSLIEVSNAEFYESNLIFPPSPSTDRTLAGLALCRVNGAYDRGGKRTNLIEAQAVVDAVALHAIKRPDETIGIVTFSTNQRDLVTNLLDDRRRTDVDLDAFIASQISEDVFVKNLENVQGDERDVILISVGYGPRIPGGRLDSMAFGPVSAEGGERRLNVLFTRARSRCEVYVSFDPADIDTSRTSGEGPKAFLRFLSYAQTGILDKQQPTGADYDSAFEADVAHVIRSLGYNADPQVGSAGFRLDLGVRDPEHPGRYILAVECDGATYHSALWARERDRLRQDVLEGLGWRFHRIWSTDWFRRRQAEIERLKAALQEAKQLPKAVAKLTSIPGPTPVPLELPAENVYPSPPATKESTKYGTFVAQTSKEFFLKEGTEPHEVRLEAMVQLIRRIVEFEGPIHSILIAQRVASSFGKERTGSRIAKATDAALQELARTDATIRKDDKFWFTLQQLRECPVRDRTGSSGNIIKSEMLPPIEIRAAIHVALVNNGGITAEEATISVVRQLGFNRTGSDLRQVIVESIQSMLKQRQIVDDGGRLRIH